ncbi:uncharacterized protein LOC127731178 [Mytilus californianus]|uniref:uncharacterized protein LOC127731178 n=1 Tax=Mytilus californianus TaxID=6549 RepID=UPI002247A699|nr:uncharacterized protein LOC127731178 [Mytilus californianus]
MPYNLGWTKLLVKLSCVILIACSLLYWTRYHILLYEGRNNKQLTDFSVKSTLRQLYKERVQNNIPLDFTFIDNSWKLSKLCKPYKMFLNKSDFPLIKYTSNAGSVKIFTHSLDDGISSIINRTGAFEGKTINRILYELKLNPHLNLIDIGTNIGQHSIAAALIGRDSIAIDAAKSNIEHVCASAHYLNIGSRITLIHNILSDTHGQRQFRYSAKNNDFGSIHVNSDGIWDKMKKQYNGYFSNNTVKENSVTLDDILYLPQIHKFKKVFVKLDVEGHEHRVLLGGKEFFKRLDVHGIIMEWAWHVKRQSAEIIKSFMTEWKFKPFKMFETEERDLSAIHSDQWPQDVLWLPLKHLNY